METSTIKPNAGLFGVTENATIQNVSLYNVSVHGRTGSGHTGPAAAGALIGHQKGGVTSNSYAEGHVGASRGAGGTSQNNAMAGGLVGNLDDSSTAGGAVRLSAADVDVTAQSSISQAGVHIHAGGLAGQAEGESSRKVNIEGSYATGDVVATADPYTNVVGNAMAGGLVGWMEDGNVLSSYATGKAHSKYRSGNGSASGLVGNVNTGGDVKKSYSTGAPTGAGSTATVTVCPFACKASLGAVDTESYWDKTTSGINTGSNGTGKTTSELRPPTGYTGDYANWNTNVDGSTGNDDPWDFGTSSQYPVLDIGILDKEAQRATRLGQVTGLAGRTRDLTIEDSYTTGRVRAGESATEPVTFTAASKTAYVGGLAGRSNQSPIISSYSLADVTSHVKSSSNSPTAKAGGLVGELTGTSPNNDLFVAASYAGGAVSASAVVSGVGTSPIAYAGGLIGRREGAGGIKASYARGDVSATISNTGTATAGGLIGLVTNDRITASYATGAATATVTTGNNATLIGGAGGLVVASFGGITDSYWDTDTSGISTGSYGTGKTTSELQTPTAYGALNTCANTDIYED